MSDDKDLYKDDLYGGGSMSIIPRVSLLHRLVTLVLSHRCIR